MGEKDLLELLEELVENDEVLVLHTGKQRKIFTSCCTSSYASYSS